MEDEIANNISTVPNLESHQQNEGDYQKAALYTSGATFLIFINAMTIASYFLRKKCKRGIPDLFMLSLAISSILTMLAVILILAYIRATGNESYDGLQALCYIQVYFGTMLRLLDVSITTAIMIDRFLALYKPLLYRVKIKFTYGKIVCTVLWIESGLIAMLPLVGFGRISMHMESFCTADWTSDIAYIVLIIAYIQFCIVLVSYVGIFRAISGLVSRQENMKNSQSLSYLSSRIQHRIVCNESGELGKSPALFLHRDENKISEKDTYLTVSTSQQRNSPLNTDTKDIDYVVIENKSAVLSDDVLSTPIKSSHSYDVSNNTTQRNRVSWFDDEDENKSNKVNGQPTLLVYTNVLKSSSEMVKQPSHNLQQLSQRKQSFPKRAASNMTKLRKHFSRRQQRTALKDFRTESLRFAKIMGVVVFLFYISWIPLAVSYT